MFKVGDKVRFKKEFYKEEYFKKLPRNTRKIVAELAGQGSFDVYYIGAERVHIASNLSDCYIDASLLEPCKKDVSKTEPAEVKVGDKIRITRYQSGDNVGTVAEVVGIAQGIVCYKSKKSSDEVYGATNDAYEIVTEPVVKEVKRVAKAGEWVKIVAEEDAKGLYKNGDILKVNGLILGICIIVDAGRVIYHREYVVLEGYEPTLKPAEVKEVSRKAEVGEYIKIVKPFMTLDDYEKGDIFKVKEKYPQDSVRVFGTFDTCICKSEYVVLENYVPEDKPSSPHKRKWTPEEIVKAKCFLAEELIYHPCMFNNKSDGRTRCFDINTCKQSFAICSSKDEYNEYIGAAVAYCKTCGVEIPEFIKH